MIELDMTDELEILPSETLVKLINAALNQLTFKQFSKVAEYAGLSVVSLTLEESNNMSQLEIAIDNMQYNYYEHEIVITCPNLDSATKSYNEAKNFIEGKPKYAAYDYTRTIVYSGQNGMTNTLRFDAINHS